MGKRKAARKPAPRRRIAPLSVVFDCLYCAHEMCVEVRMSKADKIGELNCKVCGVNFQSRINSLSAPIDVFTEWLDEAEKANKGQPRDSSRSPSQSPSRSPNPNRTQDPDDDLGDNDNDSASPPPLPSPAIASPRPAHSPGKTHDGDDDDDDDDDEELRAILGAVSSDEIDPHSKQSPPRKQLSPSVSSKRKAASVLNSSPPKKRIVRRIDDSSSDDES